MLPNPSEGLCREEWPTIRSPTSEQFVGTYLTLLKPIVAEIGGDTEFAGREAL